VHVRPMATSWNPPVGAVGLARIRGPLGWAVGAGQALMGDGCAWTHAFVVLDDRTVLEAMPTGARVTPLDSYWSRPTFIDDPVSLTAEQRGRIVAQARVLTGVPYGFGTYLWLGLSRFGLRPRQLERLVSSGRSMMCSQLVDEVYRRAGVHLFDDGRIPGDVTPGDLARLMGAPDPRGY